MPEYWIPEDCDVEEMARSIIREYHRHLLHADFLFLFRDKAAKKGGKITLATASKVSPKENAIAGGAGYAFKIEIAFDHWAGNALSWKRALLDHELCHCGVDYSKEEPTWTMLAHDLEEFACIVERHGLWKIDVRDFCKRVVQLDLFPDVAPIADAVKEAAERASDSFQKAAEATGGVVTVSIGEEDLARWGDGSDAFVDDEAKEQAARDAEGLSLAEVDVLGVLSKRAQPKGLPPKEAGPVSTLNALLQKSLVNKNNENGHILLTERGWNALEHTKAVAAPIHD